MADTDDNDTASVSRDIAAPVEAVWALVTDVTRMGEWSPETTTVSWKGEPGPHPGARFKGDNEHEGHSWNTVCTITDYDAPTLFAFESKAAGMKDARWEYHFEPTDDGCRVTERWVDQRGWLINRLGDRVSGVADRRSHNLGTMAATLDALAVAAEAG